MGENQVQPVPFKRIELHRHLDVSMRPSTLLQLLQQSGLEPQSTSLEAFQSKLWVRTPMEDLQTVLDEMLIFPRVLDRPENLRRMAFEAAEDCYREGLQGVEFRYSPEFVSLYSSLSWADSLTAIEEGLKQARQKYPNLTTGLLCIANRNTGHSDPVEAVVEFFLAHRERFAGLDLVGDDAKYGSKPFESAFKKARQQNAKITIHAGEDSSPDRVWEAIEWLGASRVGHGIQSIRDPQLVRYLAEHQICLEVCPFSNWLTQSVKTLASHPLPTLLRAGVPTTINTDDPGMFGNTMDSEVANCLNILYLSKSEIQLCFENARRATFLPLQ